jgi:hypothetical protein
MATHISYLCHRCPHTCDIYNFSEFSTPACSNLMLESGLCSAPLHGSCITLYTCAPQMHSSLCNYFLHFQLTSNFFISNPPIPGNHTNYPSPTTRYEVPPPPSAASRPPRLHTHPPPSPHQFSKHTQQHQLPHHPHYHNNIHSNANRIFLCHNYDYDGNHHNT